MASVKQTEFGDWNLVIEKLMENEGLFVEELCVMSTDEERVRACCNSDKIVAAVDKWKIEAEGHLATRVEHKSEVACENVRLQGNQRFSNKLYVEAAELYTKALLLAPTDCKPMLVLCYSNRSAAHYYIGSYQTCLVDIGRALEFDCELRLRFKLYARKARCCFELGKYEECIEVAKTALACSVDAVQTSKSKFHDRVDEELHRLIETAEEKLLLDKCNVNVSENLDTLPAVSQGENLKIPCASAALRLCCDPSKGRYLLANRSVRAGDVLFVEKPFASVLLPKFNDFLCHHCHRSTDAAIPCEQCALVRFCSYECRQSSLSEYHRLECKWLPLLYKMGILHLVMRIVVKAGVSYLLEKQMSLKTIENSKGQSEILDGRSFGGYYGVYSLVTNSQWVKPKDMFYYSVSAVLLTKLMEAEIVKSSKAGDAKHFVGLVILRHIQQLICNANAITGLHSGPSSSSSGRSSVEEEVQERIATAIYPSASLMNHSCEPNIISSFNGDVLIVRAACDIASDEEIYNCYGPHYLRMSKSERSEALLQQYYFKCDCHRCREETENMAKFKAFKCKACSGPIGKNKKCSDCGQASNDYAMFVLKHQESLAFFDEGRRLCEIDQFKESLDRVKQCLDIQKPVLYKFHPHLLNTLDLAARICAELELYDQCAEYLRQTLSATEEMYGPRSIELANELQKFTDVLGKQITRFQIKSKNDVAAARSKCTEALSAVDRGVKIFETLYGPVHQSCQQMTDKYGNLREIEKGLQMIDEQMKH